MEQKTITLNNGVEMPLLGYGVYQVSPDEAERCVADALSVGYRMMTRHRSIRMRQVSVAQSKRAV